MKEEELRTRKGILSPFNLEINRASLMYTDTEITSSFEIRVNRNDWKNSYNRFLVSVTCHFASRRRHIGEIKWSTSINHTAGYKRAALWDNQISIMKETRIDGWKGGRTERYRQANEKKKEEKKSNWKRKWQIKKDTKTNERWMYEKRERKKRKGEKKYIERNSKQKKGRENSRTFVN